MATIDNSLIVVGGPCKITDGSQVIYFEDDVIIEPKPSYRVVPNNVTGDQDDTVVDLVYSIRGKPKSSWIAGYRTALLPSALYNYTTAGARIIGAANRAVTVLGADGDQYAFTRAAVTKMPELFLGLGASLYSEVEWTGFIGQGKALTDADAFYTKTLGASWVQSDYPTDNQEVICTGAWGAVTGWTTVYAETGFKLTHELGFQPVKQGNITVDQKVQHYRGMISFVPQGPTSAQLETALGMVIGSRRSGNANSLVITGTGISVTLLAAALRKGAFVFGNKTNRQGEIAFVSALTGPGTRLTLA